MDTLDKDFEHFFLQCEKDYGLNQNEILTICRPLILRRNSKMLKFWSIMIGCLFTLWLLYNQSETFAWIVSAFGRLLLIKLLPLWNWTPLYNAKCLIERQSIENNGVPQRLTRYETEPANCVLCEGLERIPTATNTTYSFLEANYLERGLPVIVLDSHESQTLENLLEDIHEPVSRDFIISEPCDVITNLMLRKMFSLDVAIEKIKEFLLAENSFHSKWFLQLRNCKFSAVKASRRFITRPYYYPHHLEPFYSSWLLLAYDFIILPPRELYVQGLIFIQQLSGQFEWHLRSKQPCDELCPIMKINLDAGEGLVFSNDLWLLSYSKRTLDGKMAMATILEIDWQL